MRWFLNGDLRAATIFFILGTAASFLFWQLALRSIEAEALDRFQDLSNRMVSKFERTMITYEQVLRGGRALLVSHPETLRSEFGDYVEQLYIERDFPGLQGVGYSVFVPPAEKALHEARIRAEGFPDYKIRPEGPRKNYTAIVFLEPFDWRNRRAFGYDMYSNETRRLAMDAARDSGQPVASGPVKLVQETKTDVQVGFLLYLPYYKPGLPIETLADRQRAIRGYVYSPFRTAKLWQGILQTEPESARQYVNFEVYDGDVPALENLMFSTSPIEGAAQLKPDYEIVRRKNIFGRDWLIDFKSTAAFDDKVDYTGSRITLLMSLLVTTLVSLGIAAVFARQKYLAETNEHMSLLTRELSHRVKNTLAVVQAMASFSLSEKRSSAEGRDIFLKRLHALARAHTLLLHTSWHSAPLTDLVRQELEPFGTRVHIEGPDIKLNSSAAQTFALVLHELATNATKHGSLSYKYGSVSIAWDVISLHDVPHLKFVWKEYAGPAVEKPKSQGFGGTVLAQKIGHSGQKPTISYETDGLRYEAISPIVAITDVASDVGRQAFDELSKAT